MPFPDRTHGGIECGNRLSDARRCLGKQALARADIAVALPNQNVLPLAYRGEREPPISDRGQQHGLAFMQNLCTILHPSKQSKKETFQRLLGVRGSEVFRLSILHAIIGQAGLYRVELFFTAQKIRIALDLCIVQGIGREREGAHTDGLDFIHRNGIGSDDAVGATAHLKAEVTEQHRVRH